MAVLRSRSALTGLALAAFLAAAPAPARAEAGRSLLHEPLAQTFPGARLESRTVALTPADLKAVESRARARSGARLLSAHIAWRGDQLVGAAFTENRVVRTREALFFVAVAADTSIARIEVLAFFEPPDYRPSSRWLGLFRGRGARAPLTPPRQVVNVSGATLTSRAVNDMARLALAWYELVLLPELARSPHVPAQGDEP